MPPFLNFVGDVVGGPRPAGPRPERDRHHGDRSKSRSWSKSRGHKSHGKGRKHGQKH
jgi:hypothetical protein